MAPLTFIAIVLLAAAWAALLLPDLRGRGRPSRRSDSIAAFNRQLSTIERARPGNHTTARVVAFPQRAGGPVRPVTPHAARLSMQARRRRQNVLVGLLAVAFLTLVAGVFASPLLLVMHVIVDIALGGYVWLLVEHRNRRFAERAPRARAESFEASPFMRRRAAGS